ncbi:MAG TPA: ABC transporter permease, partial [Methanomicrobiales archaeon]|nr:ABC transporter permease [Methanomicrobiales archaeon]
MSLQVSLTATFIASLIALPIGALIYFREFRGKQAVISLLQTLYAMPTVIIGLVVFLFLSRSGPLGFLGLLYSPGAMIIAQTILVIPLLTGLTVAAMSAIERDKRYTIIAMGAN